ncbi:uncharacterized protein LOC122507877 isoform X2 [Leptopilina heterotoma]|uniref:uncharacterized protein LOC122507877 isoform X2 n=1 Tax=Leptopilina heterotoma TaxID=63436 RepID=UPI001CA80527|nr:uncharacterized protein LOC122507877 isoform X2 [Leptopilina heterotoma]XP_043476778.1 uncharacterized protein LOC122507877 isoform X2 [Leptopilina heterotoma]XP_043476779.1 uncharacterized protein LOC122507877 isoform X2 [Leptopilina heterotoma]
MITIMKIFQLLSSLFIGTTLIRPINGNKINLFDFTTESNIDNWMEISDSVRTVGKSKATLVLQRTQVFQRAIFFTLLNPQPNGAGFAGVRTLTNWNLSSVKNIEITCRGQGNNENYKIVLRHNGHQSNEDISYEQFFTAPMSSETFSTVTIPLDNFKPYYRGKEIIDADPLNTSNITMFGLQVYGGVYLPIKQKGVSALEIETIAATS